MHRSLDILSGIILRLRPAGVHVVFDAPLSHSRDHAGYLRERLSHGDFSLTVYVAESADRALIEADIDTISTSDSALIDAVPHPVFDLARYALEMEFQSAFDSLFGD